MHTLTLSGGANPRPPSQVVHIFLVMFFLQTVWLHLFPRLQCINVATPQVLWYTTPGNDLNQTYDAGRLQNIRLQMISSSAERFLPASRKASWRGAADRWCPLTLCFVVRLCFQPRLRLLLITEALIPYLSWIHFKTKCCLFCYSVSFLSFLLTLGEMTASSAHSLVINES